MARRIEGHRIISKGYPLVWHPTHPLAQKNGYVRENRYVAWETFGPFDPACHVHHKDENKLNNDPSNLEVIAAKEHLRLHGDDSRFGDRRGRPRGRGRSVRRPSTEQAERAAEIVRLSQEDGLTGAAIAAELGCSASVVSKTLMRHGCAPSTSWG